MHFALLIIFTNLSMATLPSLGHPSEWSTLPRNELNPSARTQVPCAQYFSFAHLRMAAAVPFFTFHFSTFEKANLVLHNPVLHLPQPLLFFRVAQCHHSSHKVFEVFHVLERVQSGFIACLWEKDEKQTGYHQQYDLTSKSLKVIPLTWGLLGLGGGRGSPSPCNNQN